MFFSPTERDVERLKEVARDMLIDKSRSHADVAARAVSLMEQWRDQFGRPPQEYRDWAVTMMMKAFAGEPSEEIKKYTEDERRQAVQGQLPWECARYPIDPVSLLHRLVWVDQFPPIVDEYRDSVRLHDATHSLIIEHASPDLFAPLSLHVFDIARVAIQQADYWQNEVARTRHRISMAERQRQWALKAGNEARTRAKQDQLGAIHDLVSRLLEGGRPLRSIAGIVQTRMQLRKTVVYDALKSHSEYQARRNKEKSSA